jgi:prepilin-type N-terminal cleavage/methylation domain-containing protein
MRRKNRAAEPQRRRRDHGFTLPELIISITVTGILITAVSSAITVVLRTAPQAQQRVAVSKDISFVQTWLPVDLASASSTNVDPTFSPATTQVLPGTNALTIKRIDISGTTTTEYYVAYRYVQSGTEWQLVRFEIRNAGTASEKITRVGVAHELAAPPAGWLPTQSPTHALRVITRNQGTPVGEDVMVTFSGGESFTTGGSGLSEDESLPLDPNIGFIDPSAPPSRCGGTITLVLDTSGSVPDSGGGEQLKNAAVGFIDLFQGTPVRMNIIGFDKEAYAMYPTALGTYTPLLNPSANITAARKRISDLDNMDGKWTPGSPDPNGDSVHWDQKGQGTNWEDGLFMPFFSGTAIASTPWPTTPDLVVLVTDGAPSMIMAGSSGTPVAAAQTRANQGRSYGARIIGVIVGSASSQNGPINNLKSVVGNLEYSATANNGAGNAADADFFKAQFVNTAAVLKQIMIAQCGGTITLQKKVDVGGVLQDVPADTTWNFSTELGDRELNRAITSSVTLDYSFNTGETSKTIRILEDGVPPGYVYDRIECLKQGAPITGRVTQPIHDGTELLLGADIQLQSDEALSCLVISKVAS